MFSFQNADLVKVETEFHPKEKLCQFGVDPQHLKMKIHLHQALLQTTHGQPQAPDPSFVFSAVTPVETLQARLGKAGYVSLRQVMGLEVAQCLFHTALQAPGQMPSMASSKAWGHGVN